MTDWPARTTHQIGANIAAARKRRKPKTTVEALAKACTDRGVPMTRSALTNLETGRRDSLAVTDLMVIAAALEIAPVALIYPPGNAGEMVEALPGAEQDSITAMLRFTGEVPAHPGDETYRAGRILRSLHRHEGDARDLLKELAEQENIGDRQRTWMQDEVVKSLQSAIGDRMSLRHLTDHEPPFPEDLALHYRRVERMN